MCVCVCVMRRTLLLVILWRAIDVAMSAIYDPGHGRMSNFDRIKIRNNTGAILYH